MTHPTEEELDALVRIAGYHREHVLSGDLVLINPDGPKFASAITALRAQLAEVQVWLEHEQEMHQITMSERDHALAALAAQIEVDAGIADDHTPEKHSGMALQGPWSDKPDDLTDAINKAQPWFTKKYDSYIRALDLVSNRHSKGELVALVNYLLQQPDLAREKALREAADKATSFLVGDPMNGVPLRNPLAHEIKDAILALIERPAPEMPIMSGDDTGR